MAECKNPECKKERLEAYAKGRADCIEVAQEAMNSLADAYRRGQQNALEQVLRESQREAVAEDAAEPAMEEQSTG